jgi:ATP-dependent helicase HrpA
LPPGFLSSTPWEWLAHYPRFLKGMSLRLRKLGGGGLARDREAQAIIHHHWQAYREAAERQRKEGVENAELVLYRWMIEELRVSLFAQELGTSLPVSPKRLEKQWEKARGT